MNKGNKIVQWLNKPFSPWLLRGVFFVVSFLLLGVLNYEYLYQLFWKSYFLYNSVFAAHILDQSAGVLIYGGRFLNQMFVHPYLAALIISALLVGVEWGLSHFFDKENKRQVLMFTPSFLLLAGLTQVGYTLFDQFEVAFFFASLLGVFFAMLLYGLYSFVKNTQWGVWVVLAVVLTPAMGIYSLVAGGMITIPLFMEGKKLPLVAQTVMTVILAYWLPKCFFFEYVSHSFLAPLPDMTYTKLFLIFASVAVSLLLIAVLTKREMKVLERPVLSLISYVAAFALIIGFDCQKEDHLFRKEMKLVRLADEEKWEDILKEIDRNEQITHTMNAYRVMALGHTKQLSLQMFNQKMPFLKDPKKHRSSMIVYYPDLFFNASFLSEAYIMVMEQWVTFREDYKLLKQLALISVLRDDYPVAKRYIDLMKQTTSLQDLAKEYEDALGDKTKLYAKHPNYRNICNAQMVEERYLTPIEELAALYTRFETLGGDNIERRLLADLFMRNIDGVIEDAMMVKNMFQYFPPCVQEAFMIKYFETKNLFFMQQIPIDRQLAIRVNEFIEKGGMVMRKNKDKAADMLFEKYGDLYIYFYAFDNTGDKE